MAISWLDVGSKIDQQDWWKDAHIAVMHFGWKIVLRNGERILVNPDGKYIAPPRFSELARA